MISHVLEQAAVASVLLAAGHEVHIILESKFDRNLVKKFKNESIHLQFFEEDVGFLRFSSTLQLLPTCFSKPCLGCRSDVFSGLTTAEKCYMPKSTVAKFLRAFGALNETVIAKLYIDENDNELKSQIPSNVLTLNWLPQNDVLGHLSTKLFITHCGNNGQHEALYHGVPMLGFPLFAEQDVNCRRMHVLNFERTMNIFEFSDTELLNQPMTARGKILFWIEHVIKHGGDHLRSEAIDLPLYQFLCLDTVADLVVFVAAVGYALMRISALALRRI
ncbi:hypothetical protein HELRODRAFT_174542 [Helobdella robusta]|uniref:UDP-glucuronosyltransferase n=1 Tax=Helobdella robusta TaxID=6412 RepID=T1F886_HELRO|nr:hypothetical protein HELRODRAFT_174542 [Helobdella robusta]ESO01584.1 hypothetical protein HELRODRAFT_174542 [Helobdella robusta]